LDLEEIVLPVLQILVKVVFIQIVIEISNVIILAFGAALRVTFNKGVADVNAVIPLGVLISFLCILNLVELLEQKIILVILLWGKRGASNLLHILFFFLR
jgi:hypothetical protein